MQRRTAAEIRGQSRLRSDSAPKPVKNPNRTWLVRDPIDLAILQHHGRQAVLVSDREGIDRLPIEHHLVAIGPMPDSFVRLCAARYLEALWAPLERSADGTVKGSADGTIHGLFEANNLDPFNPFDQVDQHLAGGLLDTVEEELTLVNLNGRTVASAQRVGLLTLAELAARPAPEPLIDGVIDQGTTALLVGASNVGKSFLAIDLAVHVALGKRWAGRDVAQGDVVFILGEGAGAFARRVRGAVDGDVWADRGDGSLHSRMHILDVMPNLTDGRQRDWLLQQLRRLPRRPSLVVLDTWTRAIAAADLDQNSNSDAGRLMSFVETITRDIGAAVLLIHHPRRDGNNESGAYALRGAVDTQLWLRRDGRDDQPLTTATLTCDKARDGSKLPAHRVTFSVVDLTNPGDRRPSSTLRVASVEPVDAAVEAARAEVPLRNVVMKELRSEGAWLTVQQLLQVAEMAGVEANKGKMHRLLGKLLEDELVKREARGRASVYSATKSSKSSK